MRKLPVVALCILVGAIAQPRFGSAQSARDLGVYLRLDIDKPGHYTKTMSKDYVGTRTLEIVNTCGNCDLEVSKVTLFSGAILSSWSLVVYYPGGSWKITNPYKMGDDVPLEYGSVYLEPGEKLSINVNNAGLGTRFRAEVDVKGENSDQATRGTVGGSSKEFSDFAELILRCDSRLWLDGRLLQGNYSSLEGKKVSIKGLRYDKFVQGESDEGTYYFIPDCSDYYFIVEIPGVIRSYKTAEYSKERAYTLYGVVSEVAGNNKGGMITLFYRQIVKE
jgi:hypothetical protein